MFCVKKKIGFVVGWVGQIRILATLALIRAQLVLRIKKIQELGGRVGGLVGQI